METLSRGEHREFWKVPQHMTFKMAQVWVPKPTKIQNMSAHLDKKKTPDVAITFDVELPIVVTKNWKVASYVEGYHVYKRVWTPIFNEVLQTRREPENQTDKYAVCILKDGKVIGHLEKGSNGHLAKTISASYKVSPRLSAALDYRKAGKPC